jgi:hypothetical protein
MSTELVLPDDIFKEKAKLLGSLLLFTMTFYKLRTGRDFILSQPVGRESHFITICRELTKVFYLQTTRLLINVPPGHGKSEIMIHFIAWAIAHYPDCQFLYISYTHDLAAKHTATIKSIMELPHYRKLFGIEISRDSSAKDDFKTIQGGAVKAFGSSGAITGQNAGLPNLNRFSGAVIMDDMHKPDEVHSDTIRETVKRNYKETIVQRPRGPNVPIIGIGQRLHEDDVFGNLINNYDGYEWQKIILKAIDGAGNALYPNVNPMEMLRIKQETSPYVFASQFQQDPIPSGGGIFKPDWFVLLDEEPKMLATFLTVDGAETEKSYNDATVFSFWGIYKIEVVGVEIDLMGLHLIDCLEIRIEPKDLESEFNHFYANCLRHKVKPMMVGIEKKSAGVTLCSVLKNKQGLQVIEIERTKADGSKTARFLEIQQYAASKRTSLLSSGKLWGLKDNKPFNLFIEHMKKITANDTHRHDDIADTYYDAIKMALIDQIVIRSTAKKEQQNEIVAMIARTHQQTQRLREQAYASR